MRHVALGLLAGIIAAFLIPVPLVFGTVCEDIDNDHSSHITSCSADKEDNAVDTFTNNGDDSTNACVVTNNHTNVEDVVFAPSQCQFLATGAANALDYSVLVERTDPCDVSQWNTCVTVGFPNICNCHFHDETTTGFFEDICCP